MIPLFLMYEIICKTKFEAKHSIPESTGKLEPPHIHNFKVECKLYSLELTDNACVLDFEIVDKMFLEILTPLKNKLLNDLPEFEKKYPSTENIAKYIFDSLNSYNFPSNSGISEVTVWEDNNHGATYKS